MLEKALFSAFPMVLVVPVVWEHLMLFKVIYLPYTVTLTWCVRGTQLTSIPSSACASIKRVSNLFGNTMEPLNKGHLSNEDTVCRPNHIELCTNLPLN